MKLGYQISGNTAFSLQNFFLSHLKKSLTGKLEIVKCLEELYMLILHFSSIYNLLLYSLYSVCI